MKLNQELTTWIQSNEIGSVNKAITRLRKEGRNAYLPIVLEQFYKVEDRVVEQAWIGFLGELKQTGSVEVMMTEVKSWEKPDKVKLFAAASWNNGLDYSEQLDVFVDWFIRFPIDVALECYSLITELDYHIDVDMGEKLIRVLHHASMDLDETKKALAEDIVAKLG